MQVSLIDMEGPTVQFSTPISSDISPGIISLSFGTCALHDFKKNVLVFVTRDSSVSALDCENGNPLSTGMIHPKKPSQALSMQILDGHPRGAAYICLDNS